MGADTDLDSQSRGIFILLVWCLLACLALLNLAIH